MGLSKLLVVAAHVIGLVGAQTASTPPAPTFTGSPSTCNKWYVIANGDTCATVEAKFGITHSQFIGWNPAVSNDCITNFWLGQAYCVGAYCVGLGPLVSATPTTSAAPGESTPPGPTFTGSPSNCNKWYLVVSGDDCSKVEASFGLTHAQFLAWNPAISSDCQTNFWPGQAYCVGVGAVVSTSSTSRSSSSTSSPSTTSMPTVTTPYSTRYPVTNQTIVQPTYSTDWPPTQTQAGQPQYCSQWHLVQPGETCNGIIGEYITWMSPEDFYAWNPAINSVDCSGLYVMYWVCVGIQPQTQYELPYETGPANATIEIPPYFTWTPTPTPTESPVFKPTPTQGALPSNCNAYVQAQAGDTCRTILATYTFITEAQFFEWNPFLNGNCDGLWQSYWYCVMAFDWSSLPLPATETTTPSPVPTDTTPECRAWYLATGTDDCAFIASIFGTFSRDQFIAWNPSVGTECQSIRRDMYYCVAIPGTPTTRSAPVSEPTTPPERPTQPGVAADCGAWWLVADEDTCASIAVHNGVSETELGAWNPALGSACAGLEKGYYICVGLQGDGSTSEPPVSPPATTTSSSSRISSTSTSAPPSTTTSAGGVATPTPVREGMVQGCKRFYFVKSGDGCWDIANTHGIALSDFYAWNPVVNTGGECWGLWPDYYVCVGI
ncbi:LysM domain-containing protein [Echria macrotheca]|uniref:LysM domain-containing protein n=1 Tax=Echria macrotheca TaxID=438768 RepID=A0AAJ0BIC0_9PEZI|nr:LysM domain-containing protein [Echria macrotheca]